MSIVEKALHKVQANNPAPSAAVGQLPRAPKSREATPTSASGAVERLAHADSVALDFGALQSLGVLPRQDEEERFTEQFRRAKRPVVDFAMGRESPGALRKSVAMITSAVAGEGKTFVSFNLSLSIARERDVSILLVDGDVAKGHITEVLGLQNRGGLTDLLSKGDLDPESLVLGTNVAGLCVLPSGRRTSGAPELFASERMTEIVQKLAAADPKRIVLFDTSPLLMTSESRALARLVDQIVLIVRAESTPQPVLLEAINLLDKTKTIRCILNQSRAMGMTEYYYGYGYHQNARPSE